MPPYSIRRLLWGGLLATGVAILASLLYYIATRALGEEYLLPLDGSSSLLSQLPISMIVITILIPGILATVFFGLLVRFSRKPATVFLSVTATALILSFGGPWYLPGTSIHTKLLLAGMQAVAAVAISGGILLTSHQAS